MVPLSLLLRTPEAVATLSQGQPTFAWHRAARGARSTNRASVRYLIYTVNRTTGLPRRLASLRREDRYGHAGEYSRSISLGAGAESRRSTWVLQGRTSW